MANGQLTQTINEIAEELTSDECKRLFYLCGSLDTDKGLDNVRGMLKSVMNRNEADHMFLPELMFRIRRYDILKKILHTNKKEVERILGNGCHVSEYRVLMTDISEALGEDDLQSLIFLLNGTLPKGRTEKSTSFLDVVVELEKLGEVSCENVELIERCLRRVHRVDLAKKIQRYQAGGQSSLAGINVCRPAVRHQCANDMPAMTSFVSPGLHNTWQCVPKPQAAENMQFSVPETGWHYSQSSPEVYRMWADPRGTCVIIDCVGSDGDMLEQTFSQLHFRVVLCKWPSVEEPGHLHPPAGHRAGGPGAAFDAVRRLFSTEACLGLAGKPKLFFIQSYSVAGLQSQRGHGDEDLEMDWPVTACAAESVPTDADIFWSLCRTSEWQLQHSGHRSVYLRALSAALLKGQERKLSLLDVHTEVNAIIYERPQSNPGEAYSISLQHTLRKTLFI
ncbi:hypothetical protein ANANG_G00062780 [Anguilla anguilla]|uniref:DED domain-containing protein n=1 Tax=Anguilla anguilla TaxID=7936 RepID=A0A9D3MRD4_ANGAN|nr:hypothetical protein ANANG_G00062780 [Anguilla anguilla]